MAVSRARPRSARARGLRTLQHQSLSAATRHAIDTEVWFRTLLAERAGSGDPRWATKDQVHDEALAAFLRSQVGRRGAYSSARSPGSRPGEEEDVTFWLDSKLLERARRIAERDGVKLARLIEAALAAYVHRHVPEDFMTFRRWVQQQAWRVYVSTASAAAPGRGAVTPVPATKRRAKQGARKHVAPRARARATAGLRARWRRAPRVAAGRQR